jgi:hypothetical protein
MTGAPDEVRRPPNWTHDRPHFFKYVTRSTARAILSNHTLRYSSPASFNDPFDLQFDLHIDVDIGIVRSRIVDSLWNILCGNAPFAAENEFGQLIAATKEEFPKLSRDEFGTSFGEAISESFERGFRLLRELHACTRQEMIASKVLCLSEVKDNILMWSHYAEDHQGLVLQLRCIPELDSAWGIAKPVRYSERMPRLYDEDEFVKLLTGQLTLPEPTVTQKLVYTKAIDWAYEKEWRIWAGKGRSPAAYEDWPFDPRELEAVYLGCRMSTEDRTEFKSILTQQYPLAQVIQAEKASHEFRLIL